MQWNQIVGHDENINSLKAMLDTGKVPHALLFVGPEGVGKASIAAIFAAGLLCTGDNEKPCGKCLSCRQIENGSHPDLMLISPDGASIKIDQVRELQREAALMPYYGRRRVGLIDAAEKMTVQAANSLLKTLEEPVGEAIFILISSARQQLLDTIISRCRILAFHPLPLDVLEQDLINKGFDSSQASAAARISGGRMGPAIGFLAEDGLAVRNQAAEMIAMLPNCNSKYIWDTAALFDKLDRQQALILYKNIILILRDILVLISLDSTEILFNSDIAKRLAVMAHNWNENGILNALKAVNYARRALIANANVRLTSEALLIKLRDAAGED